ncbi:ATP-binding protein [Alkalibacillus haloalkaliphilus]|uniref:ATP-binding protein n=1 Tax=Alkalibacillus haloalkaliphilus TaxID=94136 RepID=UPI0029356E02|nr:AAA family ATPase [Alkalibacillus haloalkaliphilus]MDV2583421.1 AAA family ATPase [Alkalibacillus haloalkaliphilus]
MYLKRLEIVSFGKWKNEELELTNGFNYLYGPNESGKSSIRMFITYVLFGLAPAERKQYTSLVDGQLGGRIIIHDEGNEYTIERFAHIHRGKRIAYHLGEKLDEEKTNRLLKQVDQYLFESIFSFKDRDLHAIRHKQTEDIGKVLFNLGLTGSDYVVKLEQDLTKDSDKLFKKQGRKPPVNEKMLQLKSLNEEIEKVHAREQQHQTLYQEAKQLEQDIQNLKIEKNRLDTQIGEAQKLLQAKSSIEQVQKLDHEMEELLTHSNLTEGLIERYEQVKAKRQEYDERAKVLINKLSSVKDERNRLMEQAKQEHFPFTLEEVQHWAVQLEQKLEQKEYLQTKITEQQYKLNNYLQSVGINLSEEELSSLELTDYTKQTWARLAQDVSLNAEKLSDFERRKRLKLNELKELEEKRAKIDRQAKPSEELATHQQQLEQLKEKRASQYYEQQLKDHKLNQKKELKRFGQIVNVSKWSVVIATAILITLLLTDVLFQPNLLWTSVVAIIGTLIVVLLHQQSRKISTNADEEREELDNSDEVELNQRIQNLEYVIQEQSELQDQLKEIQMKIDYLNGELREIESERLKIEQQLEKDETKRLDEIDALPLLESYELEQWEEVFEVLTKVQNLITQQRELTGEIDELQQSIDQLDDQLKRFLSYYINNAELEEHSSNIKLVRHYLKYEQDLNEQINYQQNWATELENQLAELKNDYQPYENEMRHMLTETNFENEETLGQAVQDFETYQLKDGQKQEATQSVYNIFQDQADSIIKQSYNWIEIEEQLSQDGHNNDEIQNKIESLRQQLADCTANIRQLEEDGKLSDLIHEKSMVEGEVIELAKQWAVFQTAKGLLQDTKARYQYEYLPKILNFTTKIFNEVTRAAYIDVRFSQEETLIVQHQNGKWFDVKQLSDGTADQLYIALRLALNESLNEAQGFPFVLDDAFVHFDEERKKQMMSILLNQSENQQLIYFSCEPYQFLTNVNEIALLERQASNL